MQRAVILHGTMGSPASNWFSWLQTTLETRGYQSWLPTLPHADRPSLREGADYVHARVPFPLDDQTLIIGHSSGAILGLMLTQEASRPLGGVVAVSIFDEEPSRASEWAANSRLFDVSLDYAVISRHALKRLFVHSDNDPYVPLEHARRIAANCEAELVVMPGEGHFNLEQSENYRQFPALVTLLEAKQFL